MSRVESFEIPSYPDAETRQRALDSAIQTEIEFLEFAQVSNLPHQFLNPATVEQATGVVTLNGLNATKTRTLSYKKKFSIE